MVSLFIVPISSERILVGCDDVEGYSDDGDGDHDDSGDDDDNYDDDDGDDKYIMVKCVSVCLSRKMIIVCLFVMFYGSAR